MSKQSVLYQSYPWSSECQNNETKSHKSSQVKYPQFYPKFFIILYCILKYLSYIVFCFLFYWASLFLTIFSAAELSSGFGHTVMSEFSLKLRRFCVRFLGLGLVWSMVEVPTIFWVICSYLTIQCVRPRFLQISAIAFDQYIFLCPSLITDGSRGLKK